MKLAALLAAVLFIQSPQTPRVQWLEFSAAWCAPCVLAGKDLKQEKRLTVGPKADHQIRVIDADLNPKLLEFYEIESLPAFVLVKDGKVVKKVFGYPGRDWLVTEYRKAGKK
jgi:thioredoxin 1